MRDCTWIVDGAPRMSFQDAMTVARTMADANQSLVPLIREKGKNQVVFRMVEPSRFDPRRSE